MLVYALKFEVKFSEVEIIVRIEKVLCLYV